MAALFAKRTMSKLQDVALKQTYLCSASVYVKHVMSNVSFACYDLIWHVEHGPYNQGEHALKTRVETSEQRSLQC